MFFLSHHHKIILLSRSIKSTHPKTRNSKFSPFFMQKLLFVLIWSKANFSINVTDNSKVKKVLPICYKHFWPDQSNQQISWKKIDDIWGFLVSKWVAGSCEQDKDNNFQFKSKTMKDSAIKGLLEYVALSGLYLILHL